MKLFTEYGNHTFENELKAAKEQNRPIYWTDVYVHKINLSKQDWSNAIFNRSFFREAVFTDSVLCASMFRSCDLYAAEFGRANLSQADFQNARCHSANFQRANITAAEMSFGDFSCADFAGADLSGSNLKRANFFGAVLTMAKLDNVSLCGCIGNGKEIRSIIVGLSPIVFTRTDMAIGCIQWPLDKWRQATQKDFAVVNRSKVWWQRWQKYRDLILKLVDLPHNLEPHPFV